MEIEIIHELCQKMLAVCCLFVEDGGNGGLDPETGGGNGGGKGELDPETGGRKRGLVTDTGGGN